MQVHWDYTVDIWIDGGSFCSSCTNKPWDGNQGFRGSAGERASEPSSCQLLSASDRNTLCDRCCPAVTQLEPHTILPFEWRAEPANTSSTGGGATAALTPSPREQPAMLTHQCVRERAPHASARREPSFMPVTCAWNTSASDASHSQNNNMIDDASFEFKRLLIFRNTDLTLSDENKICIKHYIHKCDLLKILYEIISGVC